MEIEYMLGELRDGGPGDGQFYVGEILGRIKALEEANTDLARQALAIMVIDLGYETRAEYGHAPFRHQWMSDYIEKALGVEAILEHVAGMKKVAESDGEKPRPTRKEFETMQAKAKELGELVAHDNGKWNEFHTKVRLGECLCEFPLIPKERCPVHGMPTMLAGLSEEGGYVLEHREGQEAIPYILKADRDKPPEEQTVFYFRSMISEELKGKIIEKSEEILREADLEAAFKEGVQSAFEHQGWDEGPYIEDAQLLWEESEIRKRHREGPILMGPVESVPGTPIQETPEQKEFREKVATEVTEAVVQDVMDASYEPERVKVPVKFESGTWPVGLDNLLKALRSSFAVNPDDSAYDKNLGEALAQFDGPPSTTELLETLPGVKVISEEECFPLKRCPDCLGRGGHDRQSMGINEDSWNECRRCKGTGILPDEESDG